MATIGSYYPTLIDANKASAEGQVIELLAQQNPILDDAMAVECNMDSVHRHMVRTGLPSVSWGRLYQGIAQSKSTMQQVDDTTGFVHARSEIDVRLLKLAADKAKARLVDTMPFLEALNQEMASGLFYHDTATTPEKFRGLSARYAAYNSNLPNVAQPNIANQVVNGGGVGSDNTSIWFVTWGDHATHLLYPKGTKAGVEIEDKGEQRVLDASGNPYFAKEVLYTWHLGTAVKDWRYNARAANIDVSDMLAGTVDLWALMRKCYYRLQSRRLNSQSSRIAIYMNKDVLEVLDAQSSDRGLTADRTNATHLTTQYVEGQEVKFYRGIPIKETDAILNTEAAVPAIAA
ncbi:hypothetical protein HF263_02980 [Rhizobium leguminosarum]|uniref:major capsid protein n=1 Tax=Rhizobium leguminosarum TaxID=384 RepID=UPI001C910B23|nr:hypothetical protein [Rhizobium leguminosarum]MBY3055043.1 hypothetical protein [Rhizobium leguminosarum]